MTAAVVQSRLQLCFFSTRYFVILTMFQKRRLQGSLLAVTAATLIGCGGGDGEPDTSDSSGTAGNDQAGAGLAALQPDYIFRDVYPAPEGIRAGKAADSALLTVDLGANLSTLPAPGRTLDEIDAERANYRITAIAPVGTNCHSAAIPKNTGTTITFQADQYGLCQFDVTFDRNGKVSTERLIVNYGAEPGADTPMITLTVAPEGMQSVDLTGDPATQALITAGYELQPDSLLSFGAIADASATANTLTVTAGSNGGAGRVLFTLAKTDASGAVTDARSGLLEVTVSSSTTLPPVIAQADFEHIAVSISDIVSIDLVASGIVTDADNQSELQIIHLNANHGGTVVLGDSTGAPATEDAYFHNSKFTFTSDELGVYPVNYVVSDHNGGYASGTLKINVGRLTSPDSPLAATPGRMVEWTTVGEPPNQLVVNRPVLLSEVKEYLEDRIPDEDKNTRDDEAWAYTERHLGAEFCNNFKMKLITATGFAALQKKYSSEPNGFMNVLGWRVEERLRYLIQETDREQTKTSFASDSVTGAIVSGESRHGMVICVRSPETIMTYAQPTESVVAGDGTEGNPWQILPNSGSNQLTIAISNVKGNGQPICTSSDAAINASCSTISNDSSTLTLTAVSTGRAMITVRTPDGENLIGNQPPLKLYVQRDNAVSTGAPSLSNYGITSADGEVVSNSGSTEANRLKVRPGDSLTVSWTYVEPDAHQRNDATTVKWTNATPTPADVRKATVVGLGTVTATLTPRSRFLVNDEEQFEEGTPVTLSFEVTNDPPVINDLDITSNDVRAGTAFDENTNINATYAYSDPDDDPEFGTTYVWEQKRPWTENWARVVDAHDQPVTTRNMPLASEFLNEGGRYEGNDLRLRMRVADKQGGQSVEAVQAIYPVAPTETASVTLRPVTDSNPLLIHRREEAFEGGFDREDVMVWDEFCMDGITTPRTSSYTQIRLVRSAAIDALKVQAKTLRYWHPGYVSDPKMPYATGLAGNDAVYVWNAATGADVAQPNNNQTSRDMSLVCEEVLLNDLKLLPEIPQTVLGRNLAMHWVGKNAKGRYHKIDPTPAESGFHGVTGWRSSNPSVATVDTEGLVTPITEGTTDISSTFVGVTRSRRVTVKATPTTLSLCGGKVDDGKLNSYGDCLKVGSIVGGLITGPFSDILANRFALSQDPSGFSPYSYQAIIQDGGGVTNERLSPFTGFQRGTDGARFQDWCDILSDLNFQGRTNWVPTSRAQLDELYKTHKGRAGLGAYGLGWVVRNGRFASKEVNQADETLTILNGRSGKFHQQSFYQNMYIPCYAPNP